MTTKTNQNGVILHESSDIVVIATGFKDESTNTKTGGLIQVYILYRHSSPMDAVKSGDDVSICGDCKHRGQWVNGKFTRRCYVNLGKGARAVYECFKRGGYRKVSQGEIGPLFAGRNVRWGTYGDPYFMPHWLIPAVVAHCNRFTGYTHQWRSGDAQGLRRYLMASVDSETEALQAQAMGWRTFRVKPKGDKGKLSREISCPASAEAGKRTTCDKCFLCDGAKPGDPRACISIEDHSIIANSTPMLIQISAGN